MDPPQTVPGPEYERLVMEAAERGGPAPHVQPPEEYEMSPAFREWLVESMRKEVMGQVAGAGLDRMAVLKVDEKDPEGSLQ